MEVGGEGGREEGELTTDTYCLFFISLWMVLRSAKREVWTGGWRERNTWGGRGRVTYCSSHHIINTRYVRCDDKHIDHSRGRLTLHLQLLHSPYSIPGLSKLTHYQLASILTRIQVLS